MPPLSRESRLLVLTVLVCALVLIALARLRFPERPAVETTVQPLERLAARASYDALAADIERVGAQIAPNVVVLRLAARTDGPPRDIGDVLQGPDALAGTRHVAALRLDSTAAVASLDPALRIAGIVGAAAEAGTASLLALDPLRSLARIRVPEAPARPIAQRSLADLRMPLYAVAVEGTQAGVTLRPVFLGRTDRFSSARWPRPLLPLGGIAIAPGALVFSLTGEFIGLVVVEDGALAIAGAGDVVEAAAQLAGPPPAAATVGIAVEPLTPALAAATATTRGVVVARVDPDGPAAGQLRAGDVITAIDGLETNSPDGLIVRVARAPKDQPVSFDIVRDGQPASLSLTPVAAPMEAAQRAQPLAFVRDGSTGTRAVAGTERVAEGLVEGDVIVRAGALDDPTPAELRRLLDDATVPPPILFVVRRAGEQRVVAVIPHRAGD